MANHNEDEGPRLMPVIIAGMLTFMLGALLGIASLVSQPVPVLQKEPEPGSLKPGTVYLVKGESVSTGRPTWRPKEDVWKAGMADVLTITEQELNQWSQERLKAPAGQQTEKAATSWRQKLQLSAAPVNFRLLDGRVQVSTEIRIGDLFKERTFHYQVFGRFESTPAGVRFVPEEGTLGTAPLGSIPVSRELLFDLVLRQFAAIPDTEWISGAFARIQSIEVARGQMTVRGPTGG